MVTRVPLAPLPPPPLPLLLQEEAPSSPGRPWRTPRTPRALGARKHKMEAQPEGAPLPKKRLTEDEAAAMEDPSNAAVRTPDPPLPAPEEEMEEAPGEGPGREQEEEEEAARRRLREIEERIVDEEEEEEVGGGHRPEEVDAAAAAGLSGVRSGAAAALPTLVLSDALKTGLRRDFEGGLTKRIIESMSRPSMELVLWKPLPGFLSETGAKMAAAAAAADPLKAFGISAERGPQKPERTLGGPQFGSRHAPERTPTHPPPPLLLYGNADPAGGPSVSAAEEEMEL